MRQTLLPGMENQMDPRCEACSLPCSCRKRMHLSGKYCRQQGRAGSISWEPWGGASFLQRLAARQFFFLPNGGSLELPTCKAHGSTQWLSALLITFPDRVFPWLRNSVFFFFPIVFNFLRNQCGGQFIAFLPRQRSFLIERKPARTIISWELWEYPEVLTTALNRSWVAMTTEPAAPPTQILARLWFHNYFISKSKDKRREGNQAS